PDDRNLRFHGARVQSIERRNRPACDLAHFGCNTAQDALGIEMAETAEPDGSARETRAEGVRRERQGGLLIVSGAGPEESLHDCEVAVSDSDLYLSAIGSRDFQSKPSEDGEHRLTKPPRG